MQPENILRFIYYNFFTAFNVFLILTAITLLLFLLQKNRKGKYLFFITTAYFLIISTPFLPRMMINNLENEQDVLLNPELYAGKANMPIVVLGNPHTSNPAFSYNSQLSNRALARLMEGVRIHQELPGSKLVTSGGYFGDTVSIAEGMARVAEQYGVNRDDIVVHDTPRNTCQEAHEVVESFGRDREVIVVTSATHMRRAKMLFRQVGASPIPAATDFIIKDPASTEFRWRPSTGNIGRFESAVKEYLGFWWGSGC